jgi:hypothetical protein
VNAKRCTKCGETKPPEAFSPRGNRPGGRCSWCKACFAAHARAREVEARGGPPSPAWQHVRFSADVRFWAKVDKNGPVHPALRTRCWVWTASKTRNGYGSFGARAGGERIAHRWSYHAAYGPIPAGVYVLHRCDVRACVNPGHLFLGTHDDNMRDMDAKGRRALGERASGAKLTNAQALEILSRYARGGVSQRALAREYGVHCNTIGQLVRGRRWCEALARTS